MYSCKLFLLFLCIGEMIIGDDFDGIASLKFELAHFSTLEYLGVLWNFLGLQVTFFPKGYLLILVKVYS